MLQFLGSLWAPGCQGLQALFACSVEGGGSSPATVHPQLVKIFRGPAAKATPGPVVGSREALSASPLYQEGCVVTFPMAH